MSYRSILLVIILSTAYPAFSWGNEFSLVPSLSVKEEYNSNIFFSTNDKRTDFITTLSPGLEMVNNTERLNTDVLARLDRLEYVNNNNLSSTDQTYKGSLQYLVTPLLNVSAAVGYLTGSTNSGRSRAAAPASRRRRTAAAPDGAVGSTSATRAGLRELSGQSSAELGVEGAGCGARLA